MRSGLTIEKVKRKSVPTTNEPMDLSENDVEISVLESEPKDIQNNKEIIKDVNNFDHEMFAFESELKVKTEFKIETAEGIENKKTEKNAN